MSGRRSSGNAPRFASARGGSTSGGKAPRGKRTWIEISRSAVRNNIGVFRKRLAPGARLWAVVKSNAYGHGLFAFSALAERGVDGFCIDSVIEGFALRRTGIKKPLLVLGATLPVHFARAAKEKIAVAVSNIEALRALAAAGRPPAFHVKIDTGMHRQGFYPKDVPAVLRALERHPRLRRALAGVFTHFASAKDLAYPGYTEMQSTRFLPVVRALRRAVPQPILAHAAATGGTLMDRRYHLDAVRVGMGFYGFSPSLELEVEIPDMALRPVLSWRAVVSEVKPLASGDYVGYDITERVPRATRAAVIPIGYWHGFPRALSGIGEVAIRSHRARVLGRVSMDMIVVDVGRGACRAGDVATVIGRDGREELLATDVARRAGTTHYEFLTRLNPLIERVVV